MDIAVGSLYKTNKPCWFYLNDYDGMDLEEGHVVMMIQPFHPFGDNSVHWVLCDDELGWISVEDLERCTNDAEG